MATNEKTEEAEAAAKEEKPAEEKKDDQQFVYSMVSPEEAAKYQHKQFNKGDTLRYKGGENLTCLKKGCEVTVYGTKIPSLAPERGKRVIRRFDFSFLIKDAEGEIYEVSADSRNFERV